MFECTIRGKCGVVYLLNQFMRQNSCDSLVLTYKKYAARGDALKLAPKLIN